MSIRLNKSYRSDLFDLAAKLVSCPAEKAEADECYAIAASLVRAAVEKVLPYADMLVLKKYDRASVDDCVRLQLTAGGVQLFRFNEGEGPLSTSCRVFIADEQTSAVVNDCHRANGKLHDARQKKLLDYRALIDNSRTFEDVVAVWPEAEQLRSSFGGAALATLSPDVFTRIQQDVAERAAAA